MVKRTERINAFQLVERWLRKNGGRESPARKSAKLGLIKNRQGKDKKGTPYRRTHPANLTWGVFEL